LTCFGRDIPGRKVAVYAALAAGTLAVLGFLGFHSMFSSFFDFDDEGELLVYLRDYIHGAHLYNTMYSEYGPAYFALLGPAFHLLGIPVEHSTGRMAALVIWIGASGLCGIALFRLSGNRGIGLAGTLVAFILLRELAAAQLHPDTVIAGLIAVLMCGAALLLPSRPRAAMALIGATTAAILLIKLNVGGFTLAAVLVAAVVSMAELRRHRWLILLCGTALGLLPFLLMVPRLDHLWTVEFAVLIACGSLAVAAASLQAPARLGASRFGWAGIGFGVSALTLIAIVLWHRTTPGALVNGIVVRALHESTVYVVPVPTLLLTPLLGAAGLATAILVSRRLAADPVSPEASRRIAWARLLAGLAIWACLAALATDRFALNDGAAIAIAVSMSLVWVAALPSSEDGPWALFLRVLIGELAVLELLHAYPVPGTQLAIGALPLVLVGGICIADGLGQIEDLARHRLRLAAGGVAVVSAALVVWGGIPVGRDQQTYYDNASLGLPGAGLLRIPFIQGDELRKVAGRLHNRCSTFVSLPGINSLYLWSQLPPPTHLNPGDWTFLLTASDQRQALAQIRDRPGLCLVRNQRAQLFWSQGHAVPQRPLYRWFQRSFHPTGRVRDYELMIPGPGHAPRRPGRAPPAASG
jgi:hypothetical protein